jgi:hypothetical protein
VNEKSLIKMLKLLKRWKVPRVGRKAFAQKPQGKWEAVLVLETWGECGNIEWHFLRRRR